MPSSSIDSCARVSCHEAQYVAGVQILLQRRLYERAQSAESSPQVRHTRRDTDAGVRRRHDHRARHSKTVRTKVALIQPVTLARLLAPIIYLPRLYVVQPRPSYPSSAKLARQFALSLTTVSASFLPVVTCSPLLSMRHPDSMPRDTTPPILDQLRLTIVKEYEIVTFAVLVRINAELIEKSKQF
jgi:hypothetical protein